MKKLILSFVMLLLSTGMGSAEDISYMSTVPPEVQKVWKERMDAISSGDMKAGGAILNTIIEMKYSIGLNRMDEISALLVREGYQSLEKGSVEEAYTLSRKAIEISPSYAPSYFLSAATLFKMSNIMASVSEYIRGVKVSLQDFWTLFNFIGRLYTVVVMAIIFTFFTFLIAWLLRVLPLFFHAFKEMTSGFIDSPLRPIFFVTVTILPLIFGIGWFALFWVAAAWIYLARKERVIGLLIVTFFLLLPQILKYDTLYMNGHDNVTLQGLLAVDRGYGSTYLINRLKDQQKIESDSDYLPLSIAFLLNRQGNAEESLTYYKNLKDAVKDSIRIPALNNTGNIHFREGRYDEAIAYYKKAIDADPDSVISIYNLSQAYREKLMFAEAESAYETARKMSPGDVGMYTSFGSRGKGYKIIDFPVDRSDLWTAALRPTEISKMLAASILSGVIKIPSERFPFLGVSVLIILTLLSYIKPRTPLAYRCSKCGHIVCGWCIGSRIFGGACKDCRGRDAKIEELKDLDRRISFILPGLWHIYKGWIVSGGLTSFVFFIGISGLILWGADDTWSMAYTPSGLPLLPWVSLLLLSYLILSLHFKYIKIRFNT